MGTFGVCMVKDEADVIAATLRHMAGQVDQLIVADNASTDGTRQILADLVTRIPLTVLDDPEPAYYQSVKMSALAEEAAERGAQWIVPFDADELWYCDRGRLADVLAGLECPVAYAELINHFRTGLDGADPHPFVSMVWRDATAAALPKIAFRWEPGAVIHQGNHGVDLPSGGEGVPALRIRHYPYRSPGQFVRKAVNGAAAYRLTDLPEHEGAHWRQYGQLYETGGPGALEDVFRAHFWYADPVAAGLVHDPGPYLHLRGIRR